MSDESPHAALAATALKLQTPPPVVGGYDIGNITFNLTRRPHWLARLLCRVLLDWRWKESECESCGVPYGWTSRPG